MHTQSNRAATIRGLDLFFFFFLLPFQFLLLLAWHRQAGPGWKDIGYGILDNTMHWIHWDFFFPFHWKFTFSFCFSFSGTYGRNWMGKDMGMGRELGRRTDGWDKLPGTSFFPSLIS